MLTPTAMGKMQAAMSKAPQSLGDLAEVSGLAQATAARYVRELQVSGMVHIGGWDRDPRGYATIAKFKWGNCVDTPQPTKHADDAERMRRARAKKKAGK